MKSKGNSLAILPAMVVTARMADLEVHGRHLVAPRVGLVRRCPAARSFIPGRRLSYGCYLGEDVLETLSLTTIWVCCIGVIAACFS